MNGIYSNWPAAKQMNLGVLCVLLKRVFGDNVEIARDSFDVLRIEDLCIFSGDCEGVRTSWNSVKISFPGYYVYRIEERAPGVLELCDLTEYLGEREEMVYRVDFEEKHYGCILDVWMAAAAIVLSVVAVFFFPVGKVLNKR